MPPLSLSIRSRSPLVVARRHAGRRSVEAPWSRVNFVNFVNFRADGLAAKRRSRVKFVNFRAGRR